MRRLGVLAILFIFLAGVTGAQNRVRRAVRIPDILGYKTLKCDFQIHTVFSDGSVWPDIRSEEAWREGLDAIAITDHIEYQPHQEDLPTNHDRSYEIAKPHGDQINEARQVAESTLTAVMGRVSAYTGEVVNREEFLNSSLRLGPSEYQWGGVSISEKMAIPGQPAGPPKGI